MKIGLGKMQIRPDDFWNMSLIEFYHNYEGEKICFTYEDLMNDFDSEVDRLCEFLKVERKDFDRVEEQTRSLAIYNKYGRTTIKPLNYYQTKYEDQIDTSILQAHHLYSQYEVS